MNYFLILNPGSKGGKSKKSFQKIFDAFDNRKLEYDFKITEILEDAYTFSVEANKKNYDIIVAVGGDGTINNVLNGFFNSEGKRISKSKMGVIYTGTSPDFCKSYNIPIKTDAALKTIFNNYSQNIYLGKLLCSEERENNLENQDTSQIRNSKLKYFACCANIGLGATLARKANGGIRKYLGDTIGTFVSLISTIAFYKANDFTIIQDGKKEIIIKLFNLSVGRTKFIASGIQVSNKIKYDEKGFYLMTVRKLNFSNIISLFKKVYSGKKFNNTDYLSLDYCNEIEFLSNPQNSEIEMDGDPIGFLPCKIESSDEMLELIVKKNLG